jgi:hypothetical protein
MFRNLKMLLAVVVIVGSASTAFAQHSHLNAGAFNADPFGATQADQLFFANGDDFSSESGFKLSLTLATSGTYSGFHQGNLTFTALASTTANGGPSAYHAAPGSFIEVQLFSVAGPSGGTFGFWEAGAVAPTFTLESGGIGGTGMWNLSEGDGSAGSDPFGHVHGRRFTVDTPGLYTVGFRLLDTSTNGTGGGPIHTPSDLFYMNFEAVPEPGSLALMGVGIVLAGWAVRRSVRRQK